MAALEGEITKLDGKLLEEFEKRGQAFAPEAVRLEKSRKALGLEGDYRGVVALRSQQDEETQELSGALSHAVREGEGLR